METIGVGEAKERLPELILRAAAGERFVIKQQERPLAALVSLSELKRLEHNGQAVRDLALAMGQNQELLEQIDLGQVHPAMAAFGLWRSEADLEGLNGEIYSNRQNQGMRAGVNFEDPR
jgi:prevent-host-death family protein